MNEIYVWVLMCHSKVYQEIFGVYSTEEKAGKALEKARKFFNYPHMLEIFLIKTTLDYEEKNDQVDPSS